LDPLVQLESLAVLVQQAQLGHKAYKVLMVLQGQQDPQDPQDPMVHRVFLVLLAQLDRTEKLAPQALQVQPEPAVLEAQLVQLVLPGQPEPAVVWVQPDQPGPGAQLVQLGQLEPAGLLVAQGATSTLCQQPAWVLRAIKLEILSWTKQLATCMCVPPITTALATSGSDLPISKQHFKGN
jgi:hypothetical protein